jgi:hypothetical protein
MKLVTHAQVVCMKSATAIAATDCVHQGCSEQALFVVKMLNMYTKCVHIRVGVVLFIITSVFSTYDHMVQNAPS